MVELPRPRKLKVVAVAVAAAALLASVSATIADTLDGALAQAYINNPQLNSQRAVVRHPEQRRRYNAGRQLRSARSRQPA